jgi:hypothetical protein
MDAVEIRSPRFAGYLLSNATSVWVSIILQFPWPIPAEASRFTVDWGWRTPHGSLSRHRQWSAK